MFGRKVQIDRYFLTERCSLSGKRSIKIKAVKIMVGVLLGTFIVGTLFFGSSENESTVREAERQVSRVAPPLPALPSVGSMSLATAMAADQPESYRPLGGGAIGGGSPVRSYAASQLVGAKGDGLAPGGLSLSTGIEFEVRLARTLLSSFADAPLVAVVPEDVSGDDDVVIPAGTRLMGRGRFDEQSERMDAEFRTAIFPDGSEHQIEGRAMGLDGLPGLTGTFHSKALLNRIGQAFGVFTSGVADGFKQRKGEAGVELEPGTLRNGALNGAAQASLTEADHFARKAEADKPYVEVPAGTTFRIFLERRFSP